MDFPVTGEAELCRVRSAVEKRNRFVAEVAEMMVLLGPLFFLLFFLLELVFGFFGGMGVFGWRRICCHFGYFSDVWNERRWGEGFWNWRVLVGFMYLSCSS